MSYNPFALPPRTIKELLGDPRHISDSPSVPRDNPLASKHPASTFDLHDVRASPFSDVSERSPSLISQQHLEHEGVVAEVECESGYGSSCISCILLLFLLFIVIGLIVGYYYKKSADTPKTEHEPESESLLHKVSNPPTAQNSSVPTPLPTQAQNNRSELNPEHNSETNPSAESTKKSS